MSKVIGLVFVGIDVSANPRAALVVDDYDADWSRLAYLLLHLDAAIVEDDAEYSAAFREFGLDIERLDSKQAGAWIARRSKPIELASYLDDWALVRQSRLSTMEAPTKFVEWMRARYPKAKI